MSFADLGLKPELLRAVAEKGYSTPTPIQAKAIPAVLSGQDVLGGAQTGTGKTAAFVLPVLHKLGERSGRAPRALVLTPTRELSAQVAESARVYGKYLGLRTVVVFGGVSINPQIDKLEEGCDLLIATPGRLLDLAEQGALDLRSVQCFVLDEADRMLDMGFIQPIRRVIKLLPSQRQNLMFSATYSDDIRELAARILRNPVTAEVAARNATADRVDQQVYRVAKDQKRHLLAHLIDDGNWFQVLVFTRTKHGANRLAQQLEGYGIRASAIHGNKSQAARVRALSDFKANKITALVATEVAARGLDIKELPHVVNYELPNVPEDYVHRIGRTARAGTTGSAVSLVSPEETPLLKDIERMLKRSLPVTALPQFRAGAQPASAGAGGPPSRRGAPASAAAHVVAAEAEDDSYDAFDSFDDDESVDEVTSEREEGVGDQRVANGQFAADGRQVGDGQSVAGGQSAADGQRVADGQPAAEGQFSAGGQSVAGREASHRGQPRARGEHRPRDGAPRGNRRGGDSQRFGQRGDNRQRSFGGPRGGENGQQVGRNSRRDGGNFRGEGQRQGSSFRGDGRRDGNNFRGDGQRDGNGFHGGGQREGNSFHGDGQRDGNGFRGDSQRDGNSFRGDGQREGNSFHGDGQREGNGFRSDGQRDGNSFRGDGQRQGNGFRGDGQRDGSNFRSGGRGNGGNFRDGRRGTNGHTSRSGESNSVTNGGDRPRAFGDQHSGNRGGDGRHPGDGRHAGRQGDSRGRSGPPTGGNGSQNRTGGGRGDFGRGRSAQPSRGFAPRGEQRGREGGNRSSGRR